LILRAASPQAKAGRRQKSEIHLPRTAADRAFINARIEENEVVYSILLTKAKNRLNREGVEDHFKGELSKKQRCSI
jgi:hypothetical protein